MRGQWKNKLTVLLFLFITLCIGAFEAYAGGVSWTGATSTDWNTGTNWSGGNVPTGVDVTIPSVTTNNPIVSSGTITIKKLKIDGGLLTMTGGVLNIQKMEIRTASSVFNMEGGTMNLAVGATAFEWKNNGGTFNATGGTVVFKTDGRDGKVKFTLGTNQFFNIEIDPGIDPKFDDQAGNKLRVAGNFTNNNSSQDVTSAEFTLNGTGNQDIYSASTPADQLSTFGTLIINKSSGTVILQSNIGVENTFTPTQGDLDLNGYILNVNGEIYGEPLPQTTFTIIGLPDTQYYSENLRSGGSGQGDGEIETFIAQTQWIVDNRVNSNIVYVTHLGDCVENGDYLPGGTSNVEEWINASSAMYLLEDDQTTGLTDGIPYGIAVGNHDMTPWGPNTTPGTTTLYNQYFGYDHFKDRNYYGGRFGTANNDNHYDLFEVGSLKFVVVYVKFESYLHYPQALIWANNVLSTYPDRWGIFVSHKIIKDNGDFSPEGQAMFNTVKNNSNLMLMLCGHDPGEARRTETNGGGGDVFVLLSDYQNLTNGGDGYFRIMKFSPSEGTISVKTYSPTLDQFKTGSQSQFVLDLPIPLPVELAFFTGTLNGNGIDLRWRTETEVNNYGFYIERYTENSDWLTLGFVEGQGNANSPKNYTFVDSELYESGNYNYRLKQVDNDGTFEYSDLVTVTVGVPVLYSLSQNYPNPFNPETRIDYTLPEQQNVSLRVYNILGELVQELVNEVKPAGTYTVTFNPLSSDSKITSGIYIYVLESPTFVSNHKMTFLK